MPTTSNERVSFCPGSICRFGNLAVIIFLTVFFVVIPFCQVVYYLADPAIKGEGISRFAFRVHRSLSPKYEKWARERVASGEATELHINDISGTEWPVFGSVFYLWATESLQEEWEESGKRSSSGPKVYAAGAIRAATELVVDPGHASWVKQHWGEDYLHRENVFYRMLLISAMTSYEKLIGDKKYLPFLRDQVETLSKELDESPLGLLDDYPGQCFPSDVIAAIAAIQRADVVLGTDHSEFVKRSIRGFEGKMVDSTGLPPYMADADGGYIGIARGCSSQWATVWAAELWSDYSRRLYESFEEHFWQNRSGAVGFREFSKDESSGEWYMDVDAGPVIAGHGAAASVFGLGAARANGRMDHAYPLTSEAIVLSWPLVNGTLAAPRFLSNVVHAPYVGEASYLFSLTRKPAEGTEIVTGGKLPLFTYLVLGLYVLAGIVWGAAVFVWLKRLKRGEGIPFGKIQLAVWFVLVTTGVLVCVAFNVLGGLAFVMLAQFLPRGLRTVRECKNKCA